MYHLIFSFFFLSKNVHLVKILIRTTPFGKKMN
jgi:hypothetical protein